MSYQRDYFPGVSQTSTGYMCPQPFQYQWEGDVYQRDCGKCARCLAAKKRDLAARAAAEALVSDEVVFITLTYRPGETGAFQWVSKDRQAFMVRLRNRLYVAAEKAVSAPSRRQRRKLSKPERDEWKAKIAQAVQRVRYFGCGEVGEKGTKRNHWHLILFLAGGKTGLSGFRTTPKDAKGDAREHIDLWPHGHVSIEVLPSAMADRLRAIRYCVMYLHKKAQAFTSGGVTRPACVPFRSMKPALGAEYLADWGRLHARAGLPLPSFYKVEGVTYSKGFRKGQSVKNYLSGVVRREVILAYLDEWSARYGERDVPDSDFLKRFHPEYCAPRRSAARRSKIWLRRDGSARTALRGYASASAAELFADRQRRERERRAALVRAFGPPERTGRFAGLVPLNALWRRLLLAGEPVDRQYKPPRGASETVAVADAVAAGGVKSFVVLRRPAGETGWSWAGAPSWMRHRP